MIRIWLYDTPDMSRGSYRIWIRYLTDYLNSAGFDANCDFPALTRPNWTPDYIIFGKAVTLEQIRSIQLAFPKSQYGLVNPSTSELSKIKNVDFGLVGSIEEKIYYEDYLPCVIFPLIEKIPSTIKYKSKDTKNEKIWMVYHGNKQHLDRMSINLKNALKRLAKEYPNIGLKLLYDQNNLGKTRLSINSLEIKHIQWNLETWLQHIADCQIGIVPALSKTGKLFSLLRLSAKNDYIFRFKNTTNSGRLMVFNQLKVPAVAELTPSNSQIIQNNLVGYLAFSEGSWYNALNELIKSEKKRLMLAESAHKSFTQLFDIQSCCKRFVYDLKALNNIY